MDMTNANPNNPMPAPDQAAANNPEAAPNQEPTPNPEAIPSQDPAPNQKPDPVILDAQILEPQQPTADEIVVEANPAPAADQPGEDTPGANPNPDADPTASPEADAAPEADFDFDPVKQAAAVGKVVAGAAIAAAGVPMLILPGPGVAAIALGGFVAAKGASELTGIENPLINTIENHPEYQNAAQTASEATGAIGSAVSDATKQVPTVIAGVGKAVIDAVGTNLPADITKTAEKVAPTVKSAAEVAADTAAKAAPVIKNVADTAAKTAAPMVDAAGKSINAGFKSLGDIAINLKNRK